MDDDLLSTADAASLLGVGPTTIKRWADGGLLPCVKTAGHHRRFRRRDVLRFVESGAAASLPGMQAVEEPPVTATRTGSWLERLTQVGTDSWGVQAELASRRGHLGSWALVGDELGPVLGQLGRMWEERRLTILREHLISEMLARGLSRCAENIVVAEAAPMVVLAAPPGEEHTLGLSIAEVCLREVGWRCHWAGRGMPFSELEQVAENPRVRMIALSASAHHRDVTTLAASTRQLARICASEGVKLVLGGQGPWPDGLAGCYRLRSFQELCDLGLRLLA